MKWIYKHGFIIEIKVAIILKFLLIDDVYIFPLKHVSRETVDGISG
jgi:hypothetical protein